MSGSSCDARYGETIIKADVCNDIKNKFVCQRTLRDEYDKLENLLRTKGIDPDEFLNQNKNHNGDDDDDENASECSECSCESCCEEDCCDEKASGDDQAGGKSTEPSKNEAGASTSKAETPQTSASSKNSIDEHNKRSGKDRLNVNQFLRPNIDPTRKQISLIVVSVEL